MNIRNSRVWKHSAMTDDTWRPVSTAAIELLEELPAVIDGIGRAIRERVPGYTAVSDEQLTNAAMRNVRDLLHSLRDRRPLTSIELADFAATVEERARNGVPVDEYLIGVTTAEDALWQQLWQRAGDVSETTRLAVFALRFANVNAITRVTVAAHRRIELASARAEQARRAGALRSLLRGGLRAEEAQEHLARLGLIQNDAWYVVRARSSGLLDVDRLSSANAVFVLWGEELVGLAQDRPGAVSGLTVGVAGPAPLAELPAADRQAAEVLSTAWALKRQGTFDLDDLGIQVAVQAWPQVGRRLKARYVDPLQSAGLLGDELLGTLRTYLESGGSREVTARRMYVHQNTVGYRLKRYAELTDVDLGDLRTQAELHWLFTELDLRPEG